MTTADDRRPRWFFYAGWVALSVISTPIALGIYRALISLVTRAVGDKILVGGQPHITEDFLVPYILWPALGLVTGLLQYLLLRRYLKRMGWWIAATALGLSVGPIGGRLLYRTLYATLDVGSMWLSASMVVLVGAPVGLAQWLVLRRRVHRAAWWLLISLLGWGTVGLVSGGAISGLPGMLAFTLMPAVATSVALWLLLDQLPRREGNGRDAPPDNVLELTT